MPQKKTARQNQIRIIGGSYRSRKLSFPDEAALRPTGDRIRETLFNWLAPFIVNSRCLDLFAGSGALGFEALSRGAAHVIFIDSSAKACENITKNLNLLDTALLHDGKATVLCTDSLRWLEKQNLHQSPCFDIVFLDPPFATKILGDCCKKIVSSNTVLSGGHIYLERAKDTEVVTPGTWLLEKDKQTGNVGYQLFRQM